MNRIEVDALSAVFTLGLQIGYTKKKHTIQRVVDVLTIAQKELHREHAISLSAKVTPCKIVFAGQDEDSVSISFINYPKIPIAADLFEKGVEYIASRMMEELRQNRIVVEYPVHTVMLEENADIDPKINLK